MARIINLGYTPSLDNRNIMLTGEEDEMHNTAELASDQAQLIVDECPDGPDVYIWEDIDDNWHVGW